MAEFTWPTSRELRSISRIFEAKRTADNVIFKHFPIVDQKAHLIEWWQRDDYTGLQQIRGLNGQPARVNALGGKKFRAEPGVYGEFLPIDEDELTRRGEWASLSGMPVSLDDLVSEKTDQLVVREVSRETWILWTLVATGTFAVTNAHGAVVHGDAYTTQTYATVVPWSTKATATPILDLQAVALKDAGYSLSLGPEAVAYMNRTTAFQMVNNGNAADLGGRRNRNGPFSLADANSIYAEQGVPRVEVMDEGYKDEAGTFHYYLPTGTVVVFGQLPNGETAGEYRRTLNHQNEGGQPGPYDYVYRDPEPPRGIRVHRGVNGGPALFYPGSIVVMDVTHTGA